MDNLKITGTKWYVDIEYKGNVARFNGELCVSSFAAILNSGKWIKHTGNDCENDQNELLKAVEEYNKDKKNNFKVEFYDDDYNRVI